jgi:protein TonB
MNPGEEVRAPLAAPTYLTHVTVPEFRRGRAIAIAALLHAAAVVIVFIILHHRFTVREPDQATVALVIEPSPYVGSGPTVLTPAKPHIPHPSRTRVAARPAEKSTGTHGQTSRPIPPLAQTRAPTDFAAPAPPSPPAPQPAEAAAPQSLPDMMPHLGNNQPAGFGLVADDKVIPARPDSRVNLPPAYPPEALLHAEQGRVLLSIQVDTGGRATGVNFVASSGYTILDNAARNAILGWHFVPASFRGRPVTSTFLLPVTFEIDTASASVR